MVHHNRLVVFGLMFSLWIGGRAIVFNSLHTASGVPYSGC
jgi:hypothetical protein